MTEIRGLWTIQIHQVLRPLMTPTRLFYEEKHSRVPNLFQVRLAEEGSHFTGLRIMRLLASGQDPTAPSYVPLAEVRAHFAATFGNDEDVRLWLDSLLASNLIEASTRQDFFSEEIDSLRITPFGQFALNDLHKIFTYVELVATEGGFRNESVCNELVRLSNEEVQLLHDKRRLERVQHRLKKANVFVAYLKSEEEREVQLYALPTTDGFAAAMQAALADEAPIVMASAQRNA